MELLPRFLTPPGNSFFLFGPRGTGKSTFIQQSFPDALYIDLLDVAQARSLAARPERLKELIAGRSKSTHVVIDEIQRVPELLAFVHRLIESEKDLKFVLTGSSARKLKRTGVDLLGGRAVMRTMHPFMACEIGHRFELGQGLRYGLLPIVFAAEEPADVLRAYAALYIREEVQMEGLVRNMGHFSRFLEAISFSHASLLNIANIARDCEVERKTVEGYIQVLEDILLGWRLDIFRKRAKRELAGHPKFFLFDAGVFRSLRPAGPLDRSEEIEGQALEGLVAQHLRAWIAYSGMERELYYWRTRSGVEVDFIVYGQDGIWAIEVKNTGQIRPADLRGLLSFREEYPEAHTIFLYRGADRLLRNGILCLACDQFLMSLRPDRSLEAPGGGT